MTAEDEFDLVPLRAGGVGIRSRRFGEVCHPGVGPRAEAEAVYVRGLRLAERLEEAQDEFVVWDVGLGGGANALAAVGAAAGISCRLRLLSFDRSLGQLAFALRHAAELGYFGELTGPAGELLVRDGIVFRHGRAEVRWDRVLGDFPVLLRESAPGAWPAPHAILYDPHSPAANPEMWTLSVFTGLFRRLEPGRPCALATYSRSTAVRSALLLAGFFVGAGAGTETKEETTVAANGLGLLARPLDSRWLDRARRSGAAEPWAAPPYGGRPLADATWERLRRHPQFGEGPPAGPSAGPGAIPSPPVA